MAPDQNPGRLKAEFVSMVKRTFSRMDAFARGLKIAAAMIEDGRIDEFKKARYASYDSGIGAQIEAGTADFDMLDEYAQKIDPPQLDSGRQEMLENIVNEYI